MFFLTNNWQTQDHFNLFQATIEVLSLQNRKRKLESENFVTHLNQNLDQIILRVRAKRELELKTDPPNNFTENLEEISSPELVNKKYFFAH